MGPAFVRAALGSGIPARMSVDVNLGPPRRVANHLAWSGELAESLEHLGPADGSVPSQPARGCVPFARARVIGHPMASLNGPPCCANAAVRGCARVAHIHSCAWRSGGILSRGAPERGALLIASAGFGKTAGGSSAKKKSPSAPARGIGGREKRAQREASKPCPCGGGQYGKCCQPFHDGQKPATPEELLRARFSAYGLGKVKFLLDTHHPDERAEDLEARVVTTMSKFDYKTLEVVASEVDDGGATIAFKTTYTKKGGSMRGYSDGRGQRQKGTEVFTGEARSRFVQHEGAWMYHSEVDV
ncbi:unnamed protein product [Pedinophyceae sp. YPF-701]|nr:unnamed protein product [Pedinophyceae sp. YPF-701]